MRFKMCALRASMACVLVFVMCSPGVARGAADEPAGSSTLQEVIDTGMVSWRTRDANGAACASCHAPDGFDLAYVGFDRGDIIRRAANHVPAEDGDAIADMIEAIRSVYRIPQRDPHSFRPFQPGNHLLPGATSADRDTAFGIELLRHTIQIALRRIDTLEGARAAADDIINRDLSQLPCGIPFNLWSEDIAHGQEHGLLADWIPDLPHLVEQGHEFAWRTLENAYIQNPSEANFWALWDGVGVHVQAPNTGVFHELVVEKYRAMLIAQHEFRMESKGLPRLASRGPMAFVSHPLAYEPGDSPEVYRPLFPNPAWGIGDFANFYRNNARSFEQMGVPQQVVDTLASGIRPRDQMGRLHLAWTWLGWLHDRGRQRTSRLPSVRDGDYLATPFLLHDGGYPIHGAFAIAAKIAAHSRHEPSWVRRQVPQRVSTSYGDLMRNDAHILYEPSDPTALWIYRRVLCNSFRMTMLLFADDVQRYGTIYGPTDWHRDHLDAMWNYLVYADPDHLQMNAIIYLNAVSVF